MTGKLALAALTLSVAGCATPAAVEPPVPPRHDGSGEDCNAEAAQPLVGQTATNQLGADALRLTGARTIRWIQPGQAVTMDYRPDRLNIRLDAGNRVEAVSCG